MKYVHLTIFSLYLLIKIALLFMGWVWVTDYLLDIVVGKWHILLDHWLWRMIGFAFALYATFMPEAEGRSLRDRLNSIGK